MRQFYGGLDVGSSTCGLSVEDQETFHRQFSTG